ncbi:unnamed protein product [Prorocentrum cordatum]|uniref:Uncharacterized protein n=1 Tax=Prorocentrum cordatum TaxID=2364126 RepID=A0ABN9RUM4_9DINO|nr:unnamed protein product [Polarella glacialis]
MRDQHGLTERRDALDWSAGLLDEALEAAESAQAMLRGWRPGHASSTSALHSLLAVDKLLFPGSGAGDGRGASSPQDPALALFFGALAEAASAAGLPELATSSWERVLELATKREPFSYRSGGLRTSEDEKVSMLLPLPRFRLFGPPGRPLSTRVDSPRNHHLNALRARPVE